MKTSVKTLFASALTVIVLASSAFSSSAVEKNNNLSASVDFNKVIVTGNARVVLVQSNNPHVVVPENYNKETTTIVQKADKLYITSTEKETIDIVVYVKDLQRIDACQKAIVNTRGKLSSKTLQVFLKDKASASVNGDIASLYTVLKDNASLRLKGSSKDHTLAKGKAAKLKMDQFAAVKTTVNSVDGQLLASDYSIVIPKDTVLADNITK
ncbi:MAG: DUF2807 domain-containing protein [Candidatus Pedobacter colombiensis]|uniref:DUF2807 domain-containing protein n=1 Tax=Candidatus Pedobacter colombiensis TaxID=3121371 RepID=A0AAJ6B7G7_9SPHI|nr:DUF2807 domain-containing protein [Pedobacter sp.]WEK19486.1 MAG: DUF2807 domain-containing protein [Pedobacter sp.]